MTNLAWAERLVAALANNGVGHFFLSPGARSAPLAEAVARAGHPAAAHFDERGLGFMALGWTSASGMPSACITTSGSAAANLLPACVEAAHSGQPLILVTADRPPELRGSGANQTIHQPGIFSHFVRGEVDLPDPNTVAADFDLEVHVRRLVSAARGPEPGPVHINAPFHEPLFEEGAEPFSAREHREPTGGEGACAFDVPREFFVGEGVIAVGRLPLEEQLGFLEILRLGEQIGWPVFADALSGGRLIEGTVPHADWIVRMRDVPEPSRVLHLGGALVSKRVGQWLSRSPVTLQVRKFPPRLDPYGAKPRVIHASPVQFALEAAHTLGRVSEVDWVSRWNTAAGRAGTILQKLADSNWSEAGLARAVGEIASSSDVRLLLGNSMPVRDFDAGASTGSRGITKTFGNRGASGIDGNVATLAGLARAMGPPVIGVLGDLAVLHDLNSLPLLAGREAALIVVNNGGGQIFRLLPLPMTPRARRDFVETPHDFHFDRAAAQFGIPCVTAQSREELRAALATRQEGPLLIECPFPPDASARVQATLAGEIAREGFPR